MSLIRLAYASHATFRPQPANAGVEPNVGRILVASRRNNPRDGIVGGLYYGNNRFFQCLEGDEDAVRRAYDRIRRDPRHRSVTTLLMEPIEALTFTNWTMKYVPMAEDVSRMLRNEGYDQFEPERFDERQCVQMIGLIRESSASPGPASAASPTAASQGEILTPGVRYGLVAAGVVLVAALVIGGVLVL